MLQIFGSRPQWLGAELHEDGWEWTGGFKGCMNNNNDYCYYCYNYYYSYFENKSFLMQLEEKND